ncbi:hypothetical protein BS47DRAFT_1396681 [Hydnum rufescens UP504]|uniref:DUF676 domain-containing protein n=1 Tax=Hydnum rufescens UP504 TaxID=1448309 RepID=A0A9P6DQ41_9AGAM|nr:hypothetical protein BS47DRAFT_1396681 [Hydnum rufescens UP504]
MPVRTDPPQAGLLVDGLSPDADPTQVHLLVLVHGMWGVANHLTALANTVRERYPHSTLASEDAGTAELDVLVAQTNESNHTYDGIDWGAERVVTEIRERISAIEQNEMKRVTRFSITGYSLGFFENVKPVNFDTIATPHLGIPVYPNLWSPIFAVLGPRLLSRTGKQFYATDKWDEPEGAPLLEIMSRKDSVFYGAICALRTSRYTPTPPPIETEDPFLARDLNGIEVEFHEEYEPMIKSYRIPETPPVGRSLPSKLSLDYWRSLRVPLPPAFQFHFPFNVPVYLLLPVILPLFIAFLVIRLSFDSRKSEARIKLMDPSKTEYLRTFYRGLEKGLDDAVTDLLDRSPSPDVDETSTTTTPASEPDSGSVSASSSTTAVQELVGETPTETKTTVKARRPRLTPLQLEMAKSLNEIPRLKKKLAYIDTGPEGVRINSHAIIVSRDTKRFPIHEKGMGVVRNWADSFVL